MKIHERFWPEDDLLKLVIDMARVNGWKIHHTRDSRSNDGRTDKGLPDCTLAKNGKVLLLELKTMRGRITKEQQEWLDASNGHVIRPIDITNGNLLKLLRATAPAFRRS
jgi:predicted type IV restriction endonuclease